MAKSKEDALKQRKILAKYYQELLSVGIPVSILESYYNWQFFLQEGCYFPLNWNYEDELSEANQQQLYTILTNMEADGQYIHSLSRLRVKYGKL